MMRKKIEALVEEMLDGRLLLAEALDEFERVFIERALERNGHHISNTAEMLGMHRNTVAKRLGSYDGSKPATPVLSKRKKTSAKSRMKRS